ncbi:MAG TPA: hypothetical protein VEY12_10550 [Thermoplasmata archaeon]|nr:hypothetical protein [Thermoplasmata archaeon]
MRLQTVRFRRWELAADALGTHDAYASIGIGWPEFCGCVHCRNFAQARPTTYPVEATDLMQRLGITPALEQEVIPVEPLGRDTYFYTGSFALIGKLVSGSDFWKPKPGGGLMNDREATEFLTPTFRMGFTTRLTRTPKPFRDKPVVQLEFAAEVPWVIPKRMPDPG